MAANQTVAVLGAGGTMGFPMARRIARAGISVRAWNRSPGKAQPLASDGALVTDTPAEAADGADIVLTMLADTDAVTSAMNGDSGALAVMPASAVWLQMSTIGEEGTTRCARLAAERDTPFIDAPVLGTRQPADEGKLVVLASGPERLRPLVQPVFDAIGHKTMWVGEAGAGTALKLVTNSWVVSVVEAGAEAIALAEGLNLPPTLLFDALQGGTLDLPYLRIKGKAIMERNFEPSFRLELAAKDAALVDEAARRHGLDLPVLGAVRQRLAQGVPEHGGQDFCATYLTSAPSAAASRAR